MQQKVGTIIEYPFQFKFKMLVAFQVQIWTPLVGDVLIESCGI